MVLLSDGQANLGNALEQAELLRRQGTTVDVVALPAPSGPEALVYAVEAPARVHEGAKFPVQVILDSAEVNGGSLELYVDGKLVPVEVQPEGRRRMSYDEFLRGLR